MTRCEQADTLYNEATLFFIYKMGYPVLFTLKWLSANLELWPSFNQAEQFKQPGFTLRNHLIFDVKHTIIV